VLNVDGRPEESPMDSQTEQTKNDVKTKYFFGQTWLLILCVIMPWGFTLLTFRIFTYVNMNPNYFTFNLVLGIFFSFLLLGLFMCWITSSYILIIIKNRKVVLIGIGRINIITPNNVFYFEKSTPYMGPNKRSEPDYLIHHIVLMDGKKIPIFATSISLARQRRIENAIIESIGAPIRELRID